VVDVEADVTLPFGRPVSLRLGLTGHMAEHVRDEPVAFVFLGELGGRLRPSNFRRATQWQATVQKIGLPAEFHFHDDPHYLDQLAEP
jgi:hypothetical protein